eukprot:scaffold188889_cov44-Prasinocladus_malaysianus.AAC.1
MAAPGMWRLAPTLRGEATWSAAAESGHLEVLKWARENGCPWNEHTCAYAAWGGHLEVLQWARENGCPWGEYTSELAVEGDYLEVIEWLKENGCPGEWPESPSEEAD